MLLTTLVMIICTLAGITMLTVAVSHIKRTQFWYLRNRARYLAEAGLVLARERLFVNPDYCGGTEMLDTNGDAIGDTAVTITMSGCVANGLYDRSEIRAKVSY